MLLRSLFLVIVLAFQAAAAYAQVAGEGGLKAEITGVAIPADRRPIVTFKIADAKGKPLEPGDLDPDSVKFTLAALKVGQHGEREYRNSILAKTAGKDYVLRR